MSENDSESVKRAALLKQFGIAGIGALAGVLVVEDEADAQTPYNLTFSGGGMSRFRHGPPPPLHTPPPKPGATPGPPVKSGATTVQGFQIVRNTSDIVFRPPYLLYVIPSAYVKGHDEEGHGHGDDGTSNDTDWKYIEHPLYLVLKID